MAQSETRALQHLIEAGRLLSSKLELGELLRTVLEFAARVVDSKNASLLLLDEAAGELYFDVALGLGPEASKMRLPLGEGIAGQVAKTRMPEIILDVTKDKRWSPETDKRSGFTTRSILAIPLVAQDRLVGVLEAINKNDGEFTSADLRLFESFAGQAAVAIENARLFATLREERLKLYTVFTEMTDGAVLCDETGTVIIANDAARKVFSFGQELKSLLQALGAMDVSPPLTEILGGTDSRDFEAARGGNAKKLYLQGRATRVQGSGSSHGSTRPPGWLFVFRDITEERQKEGLKRNFLSLISHKLKTPLASITGFADLLRESYEGKSKSDLEHKAVDTIVLQGRKLANLVDKLLNYVTLEDESSAPPHLEPCAVEDMLSGTVAAMKDWLEEHKAVVMLPSTKETVLGDKVLLREVFRNLVENAVKFDSKPQRTVTFEVLASDGRAHVSVVDSGPGIPPEDQDKIFRRFHQVESSFTGQVDGWGLGLPFVKRVVEKHGGQVSLKSKLGQGTVVTVSLPRVAA